MRVGIPTNGSIGPQCGASAHPWVLANENMAKALAAKGYPYQFVFARNATHCDGSVKQQTLPEALEYVWKGYKGEAAKGAQ